MILVLSGFWCEDRISALYEALKPAIGTEPMNWSPQTILTAIVQKYDLTPKE